MRINKYVATASDQSRRSADKLIEAGRIKVDGITAKTAQDVTTSQVVTLDDKILSLPEETTTIMLNKPVGYVVSKNGQGAPTIYSLLPSKYTNLNPIGRLDKDSSGLLLLSNDGDLVQSLAHPSFNKDKVYKVKLDKPPAENIRQHLAQGVKLEDGISRMVVSKSSDNSLVVILKEGRNRQIRRTFEALDYTVIKLNRTEFGKYKLGNLKVGEYIEVNT